MLRSTRPSRGYALIAVVVFTLLILTGATVVLVLARDKAIATQLEKKTSEAHGIAIAGINWMIANLDNPTNRDRMNWLMDQPVGTSFSVTTVAPVRNVWRFDRDGSFGGVTAAPPAKGVSNADWTALGRGHYAMLADVDPLNQVASSVIRAIAVVGDVQVILETNMTISLTQSVPSAFTACLGASTQLEVVMKASPFDYIPNIRFDGNGGVPLAIEQDYNRFNGLTRAEGSNPAAFAITAPLVQGRQWRGMQTLNAANGTISEAAVGGEQSANALANGRAPDTGWTRNPAITNDPRLIDRLDATYLGLGLGDPSGAVPNAFPQANVFVFDGQAFTDATSATINQQRALPLIAFADDFEDVSNTVFGESNWIGRADALATSGFYGCASGGSSSDAREIVMECLLGDNDPLAAGAPDDANYRSTDVKNSGMAWGVVQAVLRQCTGSGSSIDPANGTAWRSGTNPNGIACAPGFEHLENVAACLVVPRSATQNVADLTLGGGVYRGVNLARDGLANINNLVDLAGLEDDFNGCHPGCLIAVDADGDNASPNDPLAQEDRPFRSSCINLDPTRVTIYGPGVLPSKDNGADAFTTPEKAFDTVYGSGWLDWLSDADGNSNPTAAAVTSMALGDDSVAARFVIRNKTAASSVVRTGGAVAELGSPHLITRLDLSDRGPLGTCEQNCLAFGYGKDVTYGAHRLDLTAPLLQRDAANPAMCAAKVPSTVTGVDTWAHCNMDYDRDGWLDRKTYALTNAVDERCTDDGVGWGPAFNIGAENTAINPTACVNAIPSYAGDPDGDGNVSRGQLSLSPFCDSTNEALLADNIDALVQSAEVIQPSDLVSNSIAMTDRRGWFGGARCHMGVTATFDGLPETHPHTGALTVLPNTDTTIHGTRDWWIEDVCPDPVVVQMRANATVNMGYTCGCGVLVLNRNTLTFSANDAFLWRGIIIFNMRTGGGQNLQFTQPDDDGTFVIEGAMIAYGNGTVDFEIDKRLEEDDNVVSDLVGPAKDGHVQISWRLNQIAIDEALSQLPTPIRFLRRVR